MRAIEVVSPFQARMTPRGVPSAAAPEASPPLPSDVFVGTAEAADEAPPSVGPWLAKASGLALMVGLTLAGGVSPAAAQEVQMPRTSVSTMRTGKDETKPAARQTSQDAPQASAQAAADTTKPAPRPTSQPAQDTGPGLRLTTRPATGGNLLDVPAPGPGDLFPQLPPGLPQIPLPPLPSIPRPESEPETPTRVRTESEAYRTVSSRTQFADGESYSYGEIDFGREWTLQIKKGPWRSETTLDAGTQIRLGTTLDPAVPNGNATFGLGLGEKLSRDVGSATRLYGRAELGIQGGFGYRFADDEPLNAFRGEAALGAEHRIGSSLLYGEGFGRRVQDLSGGLSHWQYGLRGGVGHHVTERDYVQVEGKLSQYDYSDGRSVPAWGVRAGWQRKSGDVWWGPDVGYENRDGDHRVMFGVKVNF